jgi:hypothetical protein
MPVLQTYENETVTTFKDKHNYLGFVSEVLLKLKKSYRGALT